MRTILPARAVAVLITLFAACGGGDGGALDDGSGAGVFTADEQLVQNANLVLTDFPEADGWTRSPAGADPFGDEDNRRFAECLGRDPDAALPTAKANSDAFASRAGARVASTAQLVASVAVAIDDFDALGGELAVGCIKQRLDTQYQRDTGATLAPGGSSAERLSVGDIGDAAAGFRYRVIGSPGLVVDNVFVRVGRVELSVGLVGSGAPVATALQRSLVEAMVGRAG